MAVLVDSAVSSSVPRHCHSAGTLGEQFLAQLSSQMIPTHRSEISAGEELLPGGCLHVSSLFLMLVYNVAAHHSMPADLSAVVFSQAL